MVADAVSTRIGACTPANKRPTSRAVKIRGPNDDEQGWILLNKRYVVRDVQGVRISRSARPRWLTGLARLGWSVPPAYVKSVHPNAAFFRLTLHTRLSLRYGDNNILLSTRIRLIMKLRHSVYYSTAAAALLTLTACGGSGSATGTGQLTIGLTDGPVESAERVVVAFTGIQLKAADGPPMDPITFDENSCDNFDAATGTCSIDLLQLTGNTRKVVFNGSIESGNYQWVRLLVDADLNEMDSFIEIRDETDSLTMCSLWIPSGDQTGLKIVSGFTVTANGVSDYTLDFDVRKSITAPPGLGMGTFAACAQNYVMKPTIRIVDSTEVGAIAGTVPVPDPATETESPLSDDSCMVDETTGLYENVAAYVFENFDGTAVADDIDQEMDNANPVTTASVTFDVDANAYTYEAGYLLAPEDYIVALTCTADIDMLDTDEFDPNDQNLQDFSFIAERGVTTVVGETVDGSF